MLCYRKESSVNEGWAAGTSSFTTETGVVEPIDELSTTFGASFLGIAPTGVARTGSGIPDCINPCNPLALPKG